MPIFINEASTLPIPSTRDELMVVIIKQCAFLMLYIERYYEDQMIEIINRTEFLQVNDTSLQNISFLNIIIDDDKIGIIVENNNAHSEANSVWSILIIRRLIRYSQLTYPCSKSTIETQEKDVKNDQL